MSVADGMERLPLSGFHRKVLGLIGSGMFMDVFDISMMPPVLAAFVASGFSTDHGNARLLFFNFLGLAIGSFVSGYLCDRFGRRTMYQANLLIYGVASIAAAFMPNLLWITVFRFIIGLGLGGEIVVGYATLTEFIPGTHRGRWQAVLAAIANCGQTASAFVGLALVPAFGWRPMFIVAGVPSLIIWALRRALPESPRWLESAGDHDGAAATLADIQAGRGITYQRHRRAAGPRNQVTFSANWAGIRRLFGPGLLRRTVLCILLSMLWNAVLFGFTSWAPSILYENGDTVAHSLLYTSIMTVGIPIGAVCAYLTIDRIGRRWSICGYALLGAAAAVGYAFALQGAPALLIVLGLFAEIFVQALISTINGAYVPELLPTDVRGSGSGLAGAMGRVGGAIVPYVVVAVLGAFGARSVFLLFGALLLVVIVLVLTLGEETRRRTLEEIAGRTDPAPATATAPALERPA